MTVDERILAACCGDEESADLVRALLRRDLRPLGADGESVPSVEVPAEQPCGRCGCDTDEDGYCSSCSHTNPLRRRTP